MIQDGPILIIGAPQAPQIAKYRPFQDGSTMIIEPPPPPPKYKKNIISRCGPYNWLPIIMLYITKISSRQNI